MLCLLHPGQGFRLRLEVQQRLAQGFQGFQGKGRERGLQLRRKRPDAPPELAQNNVQGFEPFALFTPLGVALLPTLLPTLLQTLCQGFLPDFCHKWRFHKCFCLLLQGFFGGCLDGLPPKGFR